MNLPSHNDINAARWHSSFLLASPKYYIQLLNRREVLGAVEALFHKISSFFLSSWVSATFKGSWQPQMGRWKMLATSLSVGVNSPHKQLKVCVSALHRLTTWQSILASTWMSHAFERKMASSTPIWYRVSQVDGSLSSRSTHFDQPLLMPHGYWKK